MSEAYQNVVNSFTQYLELDRVYSINTIQAYRQDLLQWGSFLVKHNSHWSSVDQKTVNSFLSYLHKIQGSSRNTQARKIASIKSFYSYCERKNYLEANPMRKVRPPKYQRSLPKPLRPVEMEKILEDDSGQKTWIQLRDKAILEFMYSSGVRISELLPLNIENVVDHTGEIADRVRIRGKGGKERIVFLGNLAIESLQNYLCAERSASGKLPVFKADKTPDIPDNNLNIRFNNNKLVTPLFVNFHGRRLTRRGVNYILKNRKVLITEDRKISPHTLRHSFATDMINSGADIRVVQEMMGHSSVSTTQNYTYVAKERIRNTFWNCHPHAKKKDG